jgi:hypothetical protein
MSLCQFSNEAGGKVGELETADGKKLSTMNGIKPREVSASRALKVIEKSIGLAMLGQTMPLSVGSIFSCVPLFREPKKRTVLNAIGEAAMLSNRRANRGSRSQSMSNIPTILNSSGRTDLCKSELALVRAWILAESVSATLRRSPAGFCGSSAASTSWPAPS